MCMRRQARARARLVPITSPFGRGGRCCLRWLGPWGLGSAAASTHAGGECKAAQAASQGSSAITNQGAHSMAQRGTQQQQQQDKAHAAPNGKGNASAPVCLL